MKLVIIECNGKTKVVYRKTFQESESYLLERGFTQEDIWWKKDNQIATIRQGNYLEERGEENV